MHGCHRNCFKTVHSLAGEVANVNIIINIDRIIKTGEGLRNHCHKRGYFASYKLGNNRTADRD